MRTLRARTTGLVVLVTGLTLAAGGLLLVLALQGRLTASNDRVDRTHLRELAAAAATGRLPDPISDVGPEGVAQVVAADGTVLAASANITDAGPIADLHPGEDPAVDSVVAPDDDETEHYRLWAMSAAGPDGRPVTVYVGTSEEAVTEAGRTLAAALLVGVPLATALLGVATWLILGRALRRVDAIRVEVDSITGSELHRRVPASGVDDEVGRLATTMNRMLDRLEEADTRQRAFVADASHDLQSPLAAQRAQLEVALADAGSGDVRGREVGPLARDLLAGTAEMERLVQDLLFLAADDDGAGAAGPRRPGARGGDPAAPGDRRTGRHHGGLGRAGARGPGRAPPPGPQPPRERCPARRDRGHRRHPGRGRRGAARRTRRRTRRRPAGRGARVRPVPPRRPGPVPG